MRTDSGSVQHAAGSAERRGSAPKAEPIFVVGCGRSGTTLLAYILNRHSRIKATPETHYFLSIAPRWWPDLWAGDHRAILRRLERSNLLRALGLSIHDVGERFRAVSPTYRNLLDVIFTLYRHRHGAEVVCEKSPDHFMFVDRIMSWFPDARIVWIVRDGRDVVVSLCRAPFTHDHAAVHAQRWIRAARAMRRATARYEHRVHVVRYEDLVANPEEEARRLCAFLGLEFERGQLQDGLEDDLVRPSERRWKGRASGKPDANEAYKWKRLPEEQVITLTHLMRSELDLLGYETSTVRSPTLANRFRHGVEKQISLVAFVVYYDILRYALTRNWRVWLRRRSIG